jgi:uncharacterized membrane protein
MEGDPVKPEKPIRTEAGTSERFERLVSRLLLIGVASSIAVVLAGSVVMFFHHPSYLYSATDLKRLTTPGAAFPRSPGDIIRGLAAGRGQALVTLGLMMLIATPILRVAISVAALPPRCWHCWCCRSSWGRPNK